MALGTSLPYWGEGCAKGPWGTPGFWSPAAAPVPVSRALSSSTQTQLARAQMECWSPLPGSWGLASGTAGFRGSVCHWDLVPHGQVLSSSRPFSQAGVCPQQ